VGVRSQRIQDRNWPFRIDIPQGDLDDLAAWLAATPVAR
jgi:hypothetical protein